MTATPEIPARPAAPASTVRTVTVDARDPHALGGFWAAALGGRLQDDDLPGDPSALVTSGGTALLLEQKDDPGAPHRTHLDLQPALPRAEEVARLQALGAAVLHDRTRSDGGGWVVMADPEGNAFCVLRSAAERGGTDTGERPLPPVFASDERTQLDALLAWYREGVLRKVDGVGHQDAVLPRLRSGTTIAGLVKHLALVEDHWATHSLGGQPMPEPWASAPFDDDPDWEFHSATDLADAVRLYREACARSLAVTAALDLDVTATNDRGRLFSVRFVLLHLVEETARHLGHLDVLRELADGTTGE